MTNSCHSTNIHLLFQHDTRCIVILIYQTRADCRYQYCLCCHIYNPGRAVDLRHIVTIMHWLHRHIMLEFAPKGILRQYKQRVKSRRNNEACRFIADSATRYYGRYRYPGRHYSVAGFYEISWPGRYLAASLGGAHILFISIYIGWISGLSSLPTKRTL